MHDAREYERRYRRFVQGVLCEEEFRKYLKLALSKEDLIEIVVASAKALRNAVSIGEVLRSSPKHSEQWDSS